MATTVTFTPNTYAGEAYSDIAMPAFVPANGNIAQLFTVRTGVKSRKVMRTIDGVVPEFQDPSCTFTAQAGEITVGERYLDPVKYEVMMEFCWDVLRETWEQGLLKPGSANDYVPPANIEDAFLDWVIEKVAIMNEQLYFLGKAGVTEGIVSFTAAYPGLIPLLRADATVKKYTTASIGGTSMAATGISIAADGVVTVASTSNLRTGDTVTITGANGAVQVGGATINGQSFQITVINGTTFSLGATTTGTAATAATVNYVNSTNVIAFNTFIWNLIPKKIRKRPDLVVLMSTDLVNQYRLSQAQVATNQQGQYQQIPAPDFLGIKPVEMEHFPAGTALIYRKANVHLAIDADGDETQIRTAYLADATLDDLVRYKMSMKSDVNYIFGNEIMLVSPVIS